MTAELVRYEQPESTLELAPRAWQLANKIADTEFVPKDLRNRPAAVLACILAGHEVGISPMQALSKIHIIEGKSAMAAELMRALVLRHGHELEFEDMSTTAVTVRGRRAGRENWTRVTFTMDDAKKAKLDQKTNWIRWPRNMMTARATAELCRLIFPDVLAGISYAVEELADLDASDETGLVDFGPPEAADKTATAPPARSRARASRAVTRPEQPADQPEPTAKPDRGDVPPLPGEDDDIIEADVVEDPPAKADAAPPAASANADDDWPEGDWPDAGEDGRTTDAQGPRLTGPQMIAIRLADRFGIKGNTAAARAERLAAIGTILGIDPPASSKDMTSEQIGEVLRRLNDAPADATLEEIAAADEVAALREDLAAAADAATPDTPPDEEAPPDLPPAAEAPPVDEVAKARQRRVTPPPEEWTADAWRTFLQQRKVKVTEAMKEAQRLGGLAEPKVSIVTLEDVAGSGIAGDLLGYVEDLSLERSKK